MQQMEFHAIAETLNMYPAAHALTHISSEVKKYDTSFRSCQSSVQTSLKPGSIDVIRSSEITVATQKSMTCVHYKEACRTCAWSLADILRTSDLSRV